MRPYHRRRARVFKRLHRVGKCRRCGSRKSHRFMRNGVRKRQLLARLGG